MQLKQLCQLQSACNWCRRKTEGRLWREGLLPHLSDALSVDWDCPAPWNYDWEHGPEPRPLTEEERVARAAHAKTSQEIALAKKALWWSGEGPRLWKIIHTKSNPTPEWFDGIIASLPCGDCRNHARKYIAEHIPDFSDWFRWSVEFHNDVNRRLGKPAFSLEEAQTQWQPLQPASI